MSTTTDRKAEILEAAERLRAEYDRWLNVPDDIPPTKLLEEAAEGFITVAGSGDVPESCRDLIARGADFAPLWRAYTQGDWLPRTGFPKPALVTALQAVLDAAKGVATYVPKRPEPVKMLLAQGVTHAQIARYIYGHDNVGPFLGPNAVVLAHLIEQEAADPGSVIPEGWMHPTEQAAAEAAARDARGRIAAAAVSAKGPAEDPLALLREGAFATQVASVCGMTVEAVYELAAANGITPNVKPNTASMRAPQEPQEPVEARKPTPAAPVAPPADDDDETDGESDDDPEALVALYAEQHPDAGAGELARLIREAGGPSIHPNKVNAIMRKLPPHGGQGVPC